MYKTDVHMWHLNLIESFKNYFLIIICYYIMIYIALNKIRDNRITVDQQKTICNHFDSWLIIRVIF